MKNCLLFLWIALLSLSASANQFYLYDIDGLFSAPFPGKPEFFAEAGPPDNRVRNYNYSDHENMVLFSSNYTVTKKRFKKNDINEALRYWMRGDMTSTNGKLAAHEISRISGNPGITYRYSYLMSGLQIHKCSVAIFYDGRFMTWSVQYQPQYSGYDGCVIFEQYFRNLKPKAM